MFNLIFQTKYGSTVAVKDPKLYQYKQAAYAKNVLGRNYVMTCHVDGAITLAVDGCDPITAIKQG